MRRFALYCDESDQRGKFFSDFYGGLLVESANFDECVETLSACKQSQNLLGEVKWSKVGSTYFPKYVCFVDAMFDLVEAGKIKMRIMYSQNANIPVGLTPQQEADSYQMLYYQFIKHAFGFRFCGDGSPANLWIVPDRMPMNKEQKRRFKSYLKGLGLSADFRQAQLSVIEVIEIDSKTNVLMQGIDVVLGAMQFRLNDKHLDKPDGSHRRGNRTVAKEKLYKHILARIRRLRPGFNIGISTGTDKGLTDRWNHPYRHWLFRPTVHRVDHSKHK